MTLVKRNKKTMMRGFRIGAAQDAVNRCPAPPTPLTSWSMTLDCRHMTWPTLCQDSSAASPPVTLGCGLVPPVELLHIKRKVSVVTIFRHPRDHHHHHHHRRQDRQTDSQHCCSLIHVGFFFLLIINTNTSFI